MTAPTITLPASALTPDQLRAFRTQHNLGREAMADGMGIGSTAIKTREEGRVEIDQAFIARFNNFATTMKEQVT